MVLIIITDLCIFVRTEDCSSVRFLVSGCLDENLKQTRNMKPETRNHLAMLRLPTLLFFFTLFATSASAQSLLSPSDFLGYELGERFTRHHQVVDYFEHVAANSERVQLEAYGSTYEGRQLITAYVASAEHMARLEAIRQAHLAGVGLAEGDLPGADQPAIVWLSYNVHGNESVSTEAAMKTIHSLVDPENADAQSWLANTVVIIDPCLNPDGRDRYVNWYNRMVGAYPNVQGIAREHEEPWPGGRGNHYHFDLNRDWAWLTQKEVQARVAHYNTWMPHIHVDFHEQGVNNPYFFAPAAEPYHEVITPWQREFQMIIGKNHARYFDENGWLYFTRQVFDLLYPGYGDTWPTYNGSIGMTYEQAGSGRAGLGILTLEGDTLTLKDRIDHHYTTGLSTVEITSQHKDRVVTEFNRFFEQARTNPDGPYKGYVIKGSTHKDKLADIEAHLSNQGIVYGYATEGQSANGYNYATGTTGRFSIEAGDLLLSAYQPKSTLLRVLFDPSPALSDSLTYDITAWSFPYIYGIEAYASTSPIEAGDDGGDGSNPKPETRNPKQESAYAYLSPWAGMADARFLGDLLEHKVKLRYAERPFTIEGKSYAAGTLIITRTGNQHLDVDEVVVSLADQHNRTLTPVQSGFVDSGADFGSADVNYIDAPHVGVLIGSPLSSYSTGQVWHYLDQQLEFPATLLHTTSFDVDDLDDIDVLILPSGSYTSLLSDSRLSDLRAWIRQGGRLIALERAAAFLAGKDGFRLKRKSTTARPDSLALARRTYADRSRFSASDNVPGAIFRVDLDTTHPLAFGYPSPYYTLKSSSTVFELLQNESDWNVGVMPDESHVSGYVGSLVKESLDPGLVFGVQDLGRGDIVYITENPLFRAFWYNGRLLVANALFFRP